MSSNRKITFRILYKLIFGFGAIGVIGGFILLHANRTIQATAEVLRTTATSQIDILSTTNKLLFQANQLRIMESELIQLDDFYAVTGLIDQLYDSTERFEKDLEYFTNNVLLDDKEKSLIIMNSWRQYYLDIARIIQAAATMNKKEIIRISTFSSSPRFQILSQHLKQVSDTVKEQGNAQFRNAYATLDSMRQTFLWLTISGVVASILFAFILSRSLSIRIGRLNHAAAQLAEGKLNKPVPIEGNDEIADLADVFNIMQEKINYRESMLKKEQAKLEDRVKARTYELAARTKELEIQTVALREAKNQAEIANQAKSTFLSSMSHELRTPLNAILGFAQLLQMDGNLTDEQAEGIDIIHKSGDHLLTLISDILDISKIEARRLELVPSTIHVHDFLSNIANMIRINVKEKGLTFECDFDQNLPAGIVVDGQRLRQVLFNLLSNAVKFTQQGHIRFSVYVNNQSPIIPNEYQLRFEVSDTGKGISPEFHDKIFTAFEQVGDLHDKTQGTGLGLAISQRLIEHMGSRIHLTSTVGTGSTFWFDLPCTSASVTPERFDRNKTILGYRGENRTLLIVDDHSSNRSILREFLAPLGFQLLEADNGLRATQLFASAKPDLILMDMVMPEMDGYQTTRKIRKLPGGQNIPIIALTARLDTTEKARCTEAGCNGFLGKPLNLTDLLEIIGSSLEITWDYKDDIEESNKTTSILVLPDTTRLNEIYTLAKYGNMKKIRDWAEDLGKENPEYLPFANRLTELASTYQEQKLIDLVKYYLGDNSK
ncbi:ATP-binding protein [Desulfosediminicola flagellatus]|uniref:ATP-binding protein n=1 Tax=Desulfosediminicola flagellatus TaxID=2569541 RepID=UPI0010AC9C58|nr:ATP-binding protein [Desulfosediminicola flagellatus]